MTLTDEKKVAELHAGSRARVAFEYFAGEIAELEGMAKGELLGLFRSGATAEALVKNVATLAALDDIKSKLIARLRKAGEV